MDTLTADYYNRHDPAKGYDEILFRCNRFAQSAEINEMQTELIGRISGVANVMFKDGDIIRDANVVVNPNSGETLCESGAIYLKGKVRGVPEARFTISTIGLVSIGIYLVTKVITEIEDPDLYGPAPNTPAYGEPGAARLQILPRWGFAGDGQEGEFFPVYAVEDGIVRQKEPPPNLDSVTQMLARYDRESAGGTYVVNGLTASRLEDLNDGRQVYLVAEGRARVNGYGVTLSTSRRLVHDAQPDLRVIDSEPHTSAGLALQRIDLDRTPARAIDQVRITAEKTVTLMHGAYTGASDPLPDTSVLEIVSIVQGATIYAAGADYKLSAGQVDWSLPGIEPAPGSTYQVKYQYISTAIPTEADADGFSLSGAVPGSLILVSYRQMLPRIDRLCLDQEGALTWIPGVAADWSPRPPPVPASLLSLALVSHTWRPADAARCVTNDAVRVVPMPELVSILDRLDWHTGLIARQALEFDSATREAGVKKGMFVDPLLSDEMRDQGEPQTGAVIAGTLQLPVSATVSYLSGDIDAPAYLPASFVPVLEQSARTGSMPINPYDSFAPIPARITLSPALDHWTDIQTSWASPVTERVSGGVGGTSDRLLSSSSASAEFLRVRTISFQAEGFGAGEVLGALYFDGIGIPFSGSPADAAGRLSGDFEIPPGVPAGTKEVLFYGKGGSFGRGMFSGSGALVSELRQSVTTVVETPAYSQSSNFFSQQPWVMWTDIVWGPPNSDGTATILSKNDVLCGNTTDPLAQTFIMTDNVQAGAVDLWFAKTGASVILVQLRDTVNGFPGQQVLAEARVSPSSIALGGPTRIVFPEPVALASSTEYALVVLCNDAEAALSIAELGKFDAAAQVWITIQPYQVGVLFSSSNARTWTAHQDRDMSFRLLAASYSATVRDIPLGSVEVEDATDLMLLAQAQTPTAETRVAWLLSLPEGESITVAAGQTVRLPAPVSGSVGIVARLIGSTAASPILYPGTQLVAGTIGAQGDYVSRAFPGGPNTRLKAILEGYLPGGASLALSYRAPGGAWVSLPYRSSTPQGDGWQELIYEVAHIDADQIQARIDLSGGSAARPLIRNPRFIALEGDA
ncbi:MAG: DUF4815 domain-containing protein [Betaproteobacteria bacterium]|nr:DUF4815 domain-containing protein [Betaproteobacteria bacterium]